MNPKVERAKKFLEACEKSHTIAEVVERTGLTRSSVVTKLCRLRKLGIPVKSLDRPSRSDPWTPEQVREVKEFLGEVRQQVAGGN